MSITVYPVDVAENQKTSLSTMYMLRDEDTEQNYMVGEPTLTRYIEPSSGRVSPDIFRSCVGVATQASQIPELVESTRTLPSGWIQVSGYLDNWWGRPMMTEVLVNVEEEDMKIKTIVSADSLDSCPGCGERRSWGKYTRRYILVGDTAWPTCLHCHANIKEATRGLGKATGTNTDSSYLWNGTDNAVANIEKNSYWIQREKLLKTESEHGVDPELLAAMLSTVTHTYPDMTDVMNQPWEKSRAGKPRIRWKCPKPSVHVPQVIRAGGMAAPEWAGFLSCTGGFALTAIGASLLIVSLGFFPLIILGLIAMIWSLQ
jgi:hypothetical protein